MDVVHITGTELSAKFFVAGNASGRSVAASEQISEHVVSRVFLSTYLPHVVVHGLVDLVERVRRNRSDRPAENMDLQ